MRGFVCFAVACLAAAGPLRAQSSSGTTGETQGEATFLEPGKPLERTLRGGEKHIYAIRAEAGRFVHAIVDQLGIDVTLTLYAPDQRAQLAILHGTGDPAQSAASRYANPFYWAPFILIGIWK